MKTFYKKNNKIITNNDNKLVLCNKCPCKEKSDQYYAIIGFRYKSTNVDSTGSLYDKSIYRFRIEAKKVINDKIMVEWASEFSPYNYSILYLNISNDLGQCGSTIISAKGSTYTVEIFNISDKIYTDLDQFKEYFWSGCEVEPIDGVYPDIWRLQTYGDNDCWRMSNNVYTCINNHWNKVFIDRYIPLFQITYTRLCQDWKIFLQASRQKYCWRCFCWDGQSQYEYDPAQESPEGCIENYCSPFFDQPGYDYIEAWGQYMYKEPYDIWNQNYPDIYEGTIWFDLFPGDPNIKSYDRENTICWDIKSIGTTDNINNVLSSVIRNKDQYIYWQGYNSNHGWPGRDNYTAYQKSQTCNSGYLQSEGFCEGLYFNEHYWSGLVAEHEYINNQWEYLFSWGTFDLNKTSNTPTAAIGIKFDAIITNRVLLYNNTSPDNPNLSSVIFSGQIDLQFGKTYKDLPLITDIPLPQIIERPTCTDEYCDNCEGNLIITPFAVENINEIIHPSGWIKHEGIYFELTAKQYIFNDL